MGFASYLWDKMPAVVCNAAGIIAVGVFTGVSAGASVAVPIAACWLAAVAAYLAVGRLLLKKRIAAAKRIADETEDKFLLSEVVPAPSRAEDRLYYEFMLIQGRAAIERAEAAGRDAVEYREYIQEWVHEIKVPITAASLVCRRSEGEDFREIGRQLDRIYGYVDRRCTRPVRAVRKRTCSYAKPSLPRLSPTCSSRTSVSTSTPARR